MIPGWVALIGLCGGFWQAWISAIRRMESLETATPMALILAMATAPVLIRLARRQKLHPVPAAPLVACLAFYAVTAALGPGLAAIALAVSGMLYALHAAATNAAPPLALYVLGLLATPLLPSLEFYGAYPMREASAGISVALLQAQGINAVQDGVSLRVGAQSFVFDAPCSGVRMLWASCVLAAGVAYLRGYRAILLPPALVLAAGLAVFGNGVRAASLVYLESGALEALPATFTHEQIGLAAFALTAVALIGALHALDRRAPA